MGRARSEMARPSCARRPLDRNSRRAEGRARSRSTPRGRSASRMAGRDRWSSALGRRPCGDVCSRPRSAEDEPARSPRRARRGLPQRARARPTRASRARGQTREPRPHSPIASRSSTKASPRDIAMRSSPRIWTAWSILDASTSRFASGGHRRTRMDNDPILPHDGGVHAARRAPAACPRRGPRTWAREANDAPRPFTENIR